MGRSALPTSLPKDTRLALSLLNVLVVSFAACAQTEENKKAHATKGDLNVRFFCGLVMFSQSILIVMTLVRTYTLKCLLTGKSRMRLPDALNIAFAKLAATGGVPGSPTPPGNSSEATI
jgi:hypothetical protein